MNIFHVIDSAGVYGAEMVLLNLLQEQLRFGLQPLLCSIGDLGEQQKPLEDSADAMGIPVCKLRLPRGLKVRSGLAILREARNFHADIIHLHGYKDTILVGLLPRFVRKVPAIRTLHGWTSKSKVSKIWLYETLDRFCLKRLNGIVSVNASLVDQVRSSVNNVPVSIIENGIPPLSFDRKQMLGEDEELASFCSNGLVVGGIGRFSKEKGFPLLVEAIAMLVAKRPDLRLVLIGEGVQQQEMKTVVQEKGLDGKVLFTGYKQNGANYLPFFDIFVLPSLTEGLPIVLLEAMQAGVPVVATRVGGVPDVLEDVVYGELVEPGSADALAQAVLQVVENLDNARLKAEKAQQRALSHYSSRKMAERYLNLYHSVTRGVSSRRDIISTLNSLFFF